MQIDITGHHMEITDGLRQRVEEIIGRLNNHTDTAIGRAHVVLEVIKQQHHCDIRLTIGGDTFIAQDNADDMYVAIDHAAGKIHRQMQDSKNRQKVSRRH